MKNQKTNRWRPSRQVLRRLAWLSGAWIVVAAVWLLGWMYLGWSDPGWVTMIFVLAGGVCIAAYRSLPEQGASPDQPHNR